MGTCGKTHAENFPSSRFFLSGIEDLDVEKVERDIGPVDLILASPECTSHSLAKGSKPGCDISRNTAFQVVRFARQFEPRWIVVENVVSMKKWNRYQEFTAALRALGYNLREEALNSKDFGVPQSRRRLFLLCDLQGPPPRIIAPKGHPRPATTIVNLNGEYVWSDLHSPKRALATLERAERGIGALGPRKPFLLVYYGSDHAGGWQPLTRPLRTVTTIDRFAIVKPSRSGHKMRMLQVDELQRAMGMDGMRLSHGTRRDRIKMIGNAVCPPVMRAVVEQLTGTRGSETSGKT